MKQSLFTALVVGGCFLVAIGLILIFFGPGLLLAGFNLLVYLLVVPGLLFLLPGVLGFFAPWLIQWADDKYAGEEDENIKYGWHYLIAPTSGSLVASFWMTVVVPVLSLLPQLSVWAGGVFKFPTIYEVYAWGWFAVAAVCYLIGYFIYFVKKDFES